MSAIALIPARSGSKGIPGKNFRCLGGKPLFLHAVECARSAGCHPVVSSNELRFATPRIQYLEHTIEAFALPRPAALAQDDSPMIDVVKHALSEIPGPPEQIIVLLQPTQPFRSPTHVQMAIHILQESGADSVVSVTPLPLTHNASVQLAIDDGWLYPNDDQYGHDKWGQFSRGWTRRQQMNQTYIRDGTAYAFWRKTVEQYGTIYGQTVKPLIIPPEDTCELDTEADWAEVERRWKARHG